MYISFKVTISTICATVFEQFNFKVEYFGEIHAIFANSKICPTLSVCSTYNSLPIWEKFQIPNLWTII